MQAGPPAEPEVVAELTRVVIGKAQRETRFAARAVRIDLTVVEADIRYPANSVLALQGGRWPARAAGCAARPCGWWTGRQIGKLVEDLQDPGPAHRPRPPEPAHHRSAPASPRPTATRRPHTHPFLRGK